MRNFIQLTDKNRQLDLNDYFSPADYRRLASILKGDPQEDVIRGTMVDPGMEVGFNVFLWQDVELDREEIEWIKELLTQDDDGQPHAMCRIWMGDIWFMVPGYA